MIKSKLKQASLQQTSSEKILQNSGIMPKTGKKTNKVYVPIMESSQNIVNPKERREIQDEPPQLIELKRKNSEFKQKEQIYIEKLIKLQEGLEKQHNEFMKLQDIYNELFSSYKLKQQEIAELQMKFRETDRKKSHSHLPQNFQNLPILNTNNEELNALKMMLEQKNAIIKNLENQARNKDLKLSKIQKQIQKLNAEINYLKSKQRMNDSKASLNSKMFEELEEWQKIADEEKQGRIRLQYQNQFFKSRNLDLQARIKQFQQIIQSKQTEIAQLRQANITLRRENSEARLSRSRSKSPQADNSPRKQNPIALRMNAVLEQLNSENKHLKQVNVQLKAELNSKNEELRKIYKSSYDSKNSSNSGALNIREQEFFSFSRDELPAISSVSKQRVKNEDLEIEKYGETQKYESGEKTAVNEDGSQNRNNDDSYQDSHELEQLPPNMQVDQLIRRGKTNRSDSFGSPATSRREEMQAIQYA